MYATILQIVNLRVFKYPYPHITQLTESHSSTGRMEIAILSPMKLLNSCSVALFLKSSGKAGICCSYRQSHILSSLGPKVHFSIACWLGALFYVVFNLGYSLVALAGGRVGVNHTPILKASTCKWYMSLVKASLMAVPPIKEEWGSAVLPRAGKDQKQGISSPKGYEISQFCHLEIGMRVFAPPKYMGLYKRRMRPIVTQM